jgi:hypothetical protein
VSQFESSALISGVITSNKMGRWSWMMYTVRRLWRVLKYSLWETKCGDNTVEIRVRCLRNISRYTSLLPIVASCSNMPRRHCVTSVDRHTLQCPDRRHSDVRNNMGPARWRGPPCCRSVDGILMSCFLGDEKMGLRFFKHRKCLKTWNIFLGDVTL